MFNEQRFMITTTFLLLLISFELFYLTSKQFKQQNLPSYMLSIKAKAKIFRMVAGVLFMLATVLFVFQLGWTSGIIAVIIGVMAAGSLIVTTQPFQYLRLTTVTVLYFSVLLLEFFI